MVTSLAKAVAEAGPPHAWVTRSPQRQMLRGEWSDPRSGTRPVSASVALCITSSDLLIESLMRLDGKVDQLLLLAPSLSGSDVRDCAASVGATAVVSDRPDLPEAIHPLDVAPPSQTRVTRWAMTSSGTTGKPKVTFHSLAELAGTVRKSPAQTCAIWGLLYEPSRFAAIQVILQALLSGAHLLLPDAAHTLSERIAWLAHQGCTHLSATPSLWRQMLMLPIAAGLPLRQITIGGEVADDRLLRELGKAYPEAQRTHVYASTEAGVVFSVRDGKEGFPLELLHCASGPKLKIVDEMLWIKPAGGATNLVARYDDEGYLATGDRVEIVADRVLFRGRQDAVVKIGGSNVDLAQVERVVRAHAAVLNCQVKARPNPLLGRIVTVSVVHDAGQCSAEELKADLRVWCRNQLPREAHPATISVVDDVSLAPSGKAKFYA